MACSGYKKVLGRGFTIVELLVVIVVIGILVTIVAVSYSGLTRDARLVALKTDLSSSASQLELYAWKNNSYPSNLEEAELPASEGTIYQYRYNTSDYSYCLTAVNAVNESWFLDSVNSAPRKGACTGHGVDGAGSITNLAPNPSFEGSTVYWGEFGVGAGNVTRSTNRARTGVYSLRVIPSNSVPWTGVGITAPGVNGKTYTISAYIWSALTQRIAFSPDGFADSWTWADIGPSWHRLYMTGVRANDLPLYIRAITSPGASEYYIDDFMIVEGSSQPMYGDGSSPGWAWNGTPNNSTSVGPEL